MESKSWGKIFQTLLVTNLQKSTRYKFIIYMSKALILKPELLFFYLNFLGHI